MSDKYLLYKNKIPFKFTYPISHIPYHRLCLKSLTFVNKMFCIFFAVMLYPADKTSHHYTNYKWSKFKKINRDNVRRSLIKKDLTNY